MKDFWKKISPFAMLLAAAAVFIAAVLLHDRLSGPAVSALWAASGILLGFGCTGLALSGRRMTPEQRREMERGETDERNVAIREKAAMSSWYWTLYLLWAAYLVIQIFVGGLWGLAVSAVIVLHCAFYMINIYRWNKKM